MALGTSHAAPPGGRGPSGGGQRASLPRSRGRGYPGASGPIVSGRRGMEPDTSENYIRFSSVSQSSVASFYLFQNFYLESPISRYPAMVSGDGRRLAEQPPRA